jgi:hypothetical protein
LLRTTCASSALHPSRAACSSGFPFSNEVVRLYCVVPESTADHHENGDLRGK